MAPGNDSTLAGPSACTHSPKKASPNTHTEARPRRRTFAVFIAVSRLLITSDPSSSTPTRTGDSCGSPSRRMVASTARCCERTKARTSSAVRLTRQIYDIRACRARRCRPPSMGGRNVSDQDTGCKAAKSTSPTTSGIPRRTPRAAPRGHARALWLHRSHLH